MIHRFSRFGLFAVLFAAGLPGCSLLGNTWADRNLGMYVGSDSYYPDYVNTGGYYTPSYKKGGARCFGYVPAYFPGCYPGIYGGYDHFQKGASGCDANAPVCDPVNP